MREDRAEYDLQRRSRAGTTASLRAVAAGYLIYLGWTLLRGLLNGSSTLPVWLSWTAGLGFAGIGAVFAYYTWRRYRRDLEDAKIPEAETDPGQDDAADPAD